MDSIDVEEEILSKEGKSTHLSPEEIYFQSFLTTYDNYTNNTKIISILKMKKSIAEKYFNNLKVSTKDQDKAMLVVAVCVKVHTDLENTTIFALGREFLYSLVENSKEFLFKRQSTVSENSVFATSAVIIRYIRMLSEY
jgi:hypothetical protein